jgi:hypothetical protein
MFIALDKLNNQGLKQAIIVVPEKSIGGSFSDEPLATYGFWADWVVKPHWNLCNAPGPDEEKVDASKVKAVGQPKPLGRVHSPRNAPISVKRGNVLSFLVLWRKASSGKSWRGLKAVHS